MERKSILQITVLLSFVFFMVACNSNKQPQKKQNAEAVALLQKVGGTVHSSDKKSITMTIDEQRLDADGKVFTDHSVCSIKAIFPNKFWVNTQKSDDTIQYWYDGEFFTCYSTRENNYVNLGAPATTAEMIDSMHSTFDFKFPAGDFFYPSFKKDLVDFFNVIDLKGKETIDGEACTKIVAQNENADVNIWVSDATSLPKKFNVIDKTQKNIKYEAVFNKWDMQPSFDTSVFDAVVPEDAHLINIMAKK